ncbi:MAG: SH3 domain-containing protein [Flavobacteriales bacterium]|nr:SH3 domain-containing protein [Flavobacteriales bacterium]
MKKFIFILMIGFGFVATSQNAEKFSQGIEFYKQAEYEKAISVWNSILDSGEHSAALYFNLGNAHYKLNEVAPSIYFYEKALLLSPNDKEIKNNLAFAQNKTVDAITPLPQNVFSKWYANFLGTLSFNGWAWAGVALVVLFVVLFLSYYFSYTEYKKRFYFSTSIFALLFAIGSFAFAFLSYEKFTNNQSAIIFSEISQVRSEPLMRSTISFVLHEGTKVRITEEDGDWKRIELADGKEGWMPSSDLKVL